MAVIAPAIACGVTISTSMPELCSDCDNGGTEAEVFAGAEGAEFVQPPHIAAMKSDEINNGRMILRWNISSIPLGRLRTIAGALRSPAQDPAATSGNQRSFGKSRPTYRVACGSHRATQA